MPLLTKVSDSGKMNIPAQIRRQTGLERSGPVVMTVVAGEIRLRPVRRSDRPAADAEFGVRRLGETVDRFLAERRIEAVATKPTAGRGSPEWAAAPGSQSIVILDASAVLAFLLREPVRTASWRLCWPNRA